MSPIALTEPVASPGPICLGRQVLVHFLTLRICRGCRVLRRRWVKACFRTGTGCNIRCLAFLVLHRWSFRVGFGFEGLPPPSPLHLLFVSCPLICIYRPFGEVVGPSTGLQCPQLAAA